MTTTTTKMCHNTKVVESSTLITPINNNKTRQTSWSNNIDVVAVTMFSSKTEEEKKTENERLRRDVRGEVAGPTW